MCDFVLSLTPETKTRLESLAVKLDKPVSECLQMAVSEFMDSWENHFGTLSGLESGEERPVLKVVNDAASAFPPGLR